jgi:hypothetical protein
LHEDTAYEEEQETNRIIAGHLDQLDREQREVYDELILEIDQNPHAANTSILDKHLLAFRNITPRMANRRQAQRIESARMFEEKFDEFRETFLFGAFRRRQRNNRS